MTKAPKKEKQKKQNQPPHMPFDEALRVLLKAKPQHKTQGQKKKG
jgi:hypothetical protein